MFFGTIGNKFELLETNSKSGIEWCRNHFKNFRTYDKSLNIVGKKFSSEINAGSIVDNRDSSKIHNHLTVLTMPSTKFFYTSCRQWTSHYDICWKCQLPFQAIRMICFIFMTNYSAPVVPYTNFEPRLIASLHTVPRFTITLFYVLFSISTCFSFA